jgi:hypothetical protein
MKATYSISTLLIAAALAISPAFVAPACAGNISLPPVTILMGLPPLVAPTGGCPGGSGGSSGFCAVQGDLPYIAGVMIQIYWAQGQTVNGLDLGIESNSTQGSYNWTNFDTTINNYAAQTCGANLAGGGHPCYVALVDGSASNIPNNNPNSNTPQYVATQAAADALTPAWAPGTYSENLSVLYGGVYYQQNSGATCTDVTFGSGCTWASTGAHAAPQNFAFSSGLPGTSNPNWPTSTNANINSTTCNGAQCTATLLVAGFPAPETPILMAKKAFRAALLAHIKASSYSSNIVYLRVCIGEGGENWSRNNTQLQLLVGNNATRLQNQWLEYLYLSESIAVSLWKTAGVGFPLDGSFEGGQFGLTSGAADIMASYAAQLGLGMGQQGIQTNDVNNFAGGSSCSNDWCNVMQTYPNSTLFEMQSVGQSDPTNTTGPVKSLIYLLPLYAQLRGNTKIYFEAWQGDLRCAYESGYSDSNGCTNGLAPVIAYQNLFQQLQAGVPSPFASAMAPRTH